MDNFNCFVIRNELSLGKLLARKKEREVGSEAEKDCSCFQEYTCASQPVNEQFQANTTRDVTSWSCFSQGHTLSCFPRDDPTQLVRVARRRDERRSRSREDPTENALIASERMPRLARSHDHFVDDFAGLHQCAGFAIDCRGHGPTVGREGGHAQVHIGVVRACGERRRL